MNTRFGLARSVSIALFWCVLFVTALTMAMIPLLSTLGDQSRVTVCSA
jgi:hypothetical protein